MPSSKAYRTTSRRSFTPFPTQSHPRSSLVSPMCTASWTTTIISMTSLPSTLGLHVCEVSLKPFLHSHWWQLVLNPCISYEGLKLDYGDDLTLSSHLEDSKINLFKYFDKNYATLPTPMPLLPSTPVRAPMDGSPQKSFTAQYHWKEKHSTNELEEYFKLPAEDFKTCDPIQWWVGQQSQFPHLFQLARDILCIPGKYFNNFNSCDLDLNCQCQVLLLLLKGYSQVGRTPSLSNVPVSKPTQFVHSWLSRSAFTLSIPGPKLASGVRPRNEGGIYCWEQTFR